MYTSIIIITTVPIHVQIENYHYNCCHTCTERQLSLHLFSYMYKSIVISTTVLIRMQFSVITTVHIHERLSDITTILMHVRSSIVTCVLIHVQFRISTTVLTRPQLSVSRMLSLVLRAIQSICCEEENEFKGCCAL